MKRRFFVPALTGFIAMFLLFAVTSFAQDKKHSPEQHAKKQTDKMKAGVQLTDEQYSKVYDLNLSFANKMQELKKKDGSMDEKKDAMKSIRKERNTALSAILSKEQMEKYKTLQKEQHKEMHNRKMQKSEQS